MKSPKLKIMFLVDTEADFYYKIPSPHFSRKDLLKWKINKILGKIYKYPQPSRKGFVNLLKIFKKYEVPATFCLVGHLYLKSCKGFPHFGEKKPQSSWYRNKIGSDWYFWDKGENYKKSPGLYLGDLVEKYKKEELFEFGLHAFSHEALTLESKETIDSIISAGISAADKAGIKIKSFASPFEMTEEEKEPNKIFDVLRKRQLKRIFYCGPDKGLKIKRVLGIKKAAIKDSLEFIWISKYLEGSPQKKHSKNSFKIINEIKKNSEKEAIYCLAMHDFTWKNTKNLEKILIFLKKNSFEFYK
jgi:peptidoglycan/xylan/chitin deacetylase (PgdA/CDA1 family)